LTTDINAVLNDPNIHVVVELIGGMTPAKDILLQAVRCGKHVVTANKELWLPAARNCSGKLMLITV